MDASAITPEGAKAILDALGALKTVVALSLLASVVLIIVTWLVVRYLDKRNSLKHEERMRKAEVEEQKRLDDGKNKRAEEMRNTWKQLASEVKGLRTDTREQTDRLEKHLKDDEESSQNLRKTLANMDSTQKQLKESIESLSIVVGDISVRQAGGISRANAMTIIENMMNDVVKRDVLGIFDYSLMKNDYARRSDFIRTRVKTTIGNAIIAAAKNLHAFGYMSISPACYFPYYLEEKEHGGGVRFLLCDDLWAAVNPLYDSSKPYEERVDEMRLVVANVIADAITRGREAAENFYEDNGNQDPAGVFRPHGAETKKHRSGEWQVSSDSALAPKR